MENNLFLLQKAKQDAEIAVRGVEAERSAFLAKRRRDAEEEADQQFGARLDAAREMAQAARLAELAEKDRIAKTGEGAPFPLGTKLCKWENKETSRFSRKYAWEKVADGVMEAFTTESDGPANLRYGAANVGDFVVRVLKKDGTPGARYERIGDTWRGKWLPIGQTPKSGD